MHSMKLERGRREEAIRPRQRQPEQKEVEYVGKRMHS